MKRFHTKSITFTLLLILLLSQNSLSKTDNFQKKYLHLKAISEYKRAINILVDWSKALKDPVLLELNIFRIYEILKYPELYNDGLMALEKISRINAVKNNLPVLARAIQYKNILLLKKGMIKSVKENSHLLGFMNFYAIGPYTNNSISDFNKTYPPERDFQKKVYPGKVHNIHWFKVYTEHSGEINIGQYFSDIKNSFFYLYNEIHINRDGEYYIVLGKTGFTDIRLDGKIIFNNRNRHNFLYDQYFIKVFLKNGSF